MFNNIALPLNQSAVISVASFDISELGSEALMKLFRETTSCIQDIRIEIVTNRRRRRGQEEHPARTLGVTVQRSTIQFDDSLDRGQRIEAIAHELVHLLLIYRHGLRMVDRRIPQLRSNKDIFDYFLNLNKFWNYFLGQALNTIHHQILIGYLKEEYGIPSALHLALFLHNSRIVANHQNPDKESQYAKGLIAFECEKLVGKADRAINPYGQSESIWKAYCSAKKFFEAYSFKKIPAPSTYEEDILSFLDDLGYRRQDFEFFP